MSSFEAVGGGVIWLIVATFREVNGYRTIDGWNRRGSGESEEVERIVRDEGDVVWRRTVKNEGSSKAGVIADRCVNLQLWKECFCEGVRRRRRCGVEPY